MSSIKEVTHTSKSDFWDNLEFYRYGYSAMALLVQTCVGSIGVMYALHLDGMLSIIALSVVIAFNLAANSLCIGLAPVKVVFWSGVASVTLSIIVIIMGLTMGA